MGLTDKEVGIVQDFEIEKGEALPDNIEAPISALDLEEENRRQVGKPSRQLPRPRLIRRRGFFNEVMETLLLVLAIYVLVNLSTARFVVEGRSMEPNFHTNEYIIVSRLAYILGDPQRGDVVVFHREPGRDFIKRVVGLPGELVEMREGKVYINGKPLNEPYVESLCRSSTCKQRSWQLGKDEYFVLGDNRNASQDSHDFGAIKREQIVGKAWIRYWPLEESSVIDSHHDYDLTPEEAIPLTTPVPEPPDSEDFSSGGL